MFRNLSTYVLALLLGLPAVALAQGTGTLAGRVVDDTGEGLPGANVLIVGTTLGAATDMDGNYRIIGVAVGTYSVTASYIGYTTVQQTGVDISSGYTRTLDFTLTEGGEGVELGEVTVTYERPLIQNDAIGVPRVVTGDAIQNLPVRGVNNIAAIQGGVVSSGNDAGSLFVRGGREQEVAYYVDGVKVAPNALVGVNNGAIQEQEMLIGTIPARYGDVQAGVISITTRSGAEQFFGSFEGITSEGLDDYGYNLAALSVGGPIVPGRAGFFLSAEGNWVADSNPYGIPSYQLDESAFNLLQASPQSLEFTGGNGSTIYVPIPADFNLTGLTPAQVTDSLFTLGLINDTTATLANTALLSTALTFDESLYSLQRGKDDPLARLTLNGSVNVNITPTTTLRLGGGLENRDREEYTFGRSLYNTYFYNDQRDSYRMFGTLRQRIGQSAFFQIQGEYQDFQYVQYPEGFSSDIGDVLSYGDAQNDYLATARRYYTLSTCDADGDPTTPGTVACYAQQFGRDSGVRPTTIEPGTFTLAGAPLTGYEQRHDQQFRFTGSATAQLGVHQVEFGGEYEQQTQRFFRVAGNGLAQYAADGSLEATVPGLPFEVDPVTGDTTVIGVASYDQLPYQAFGLPSIAGTSYYYYGYNYNGTQEVDDEDADAYFAGTNRNVAPYQPIYYAGYVQDKIEFSDLVLNLGLRVDVFDNNTDVLRDLWATTPIIRANTIQNRPSGIGDDYAVYFANDGTTVVGYRDLEGNFFNEFGEEVDVTDVTNRGSQVGDSSQPRSAAFKPYEAQVTVMPRIGVSFPVTDRALFFASYNVTSQRPTEFAYAPISVYEAAASAQSRLPNAGLEPEITTQYELGFRQRLGENAALTISGFYRTQENKIAVRQLNGGFPVYSSFQNVDFTTSQGVEVGFDLRRTRNLAIAANYTLSFAKGTGSDAQAVGTIAWRGTFFPNFITPADFDQRHSANLSLDYRFGDNEGPMIGGMRLLENFGVNLLAQFGSGQRYTPTQLNPTFVADSFTPDIRGNINTGVLPSYSRFDLKVDRSFDVGFSDVQLYLWVQDLFNTRNVTAVYRATGLASDDGYLNTAGAQNTIFGTRTPAATAFNYSAYTQGPVNVGGNQSSAAGAFYDLPRQIRLGLLLNF